MLKYQLFPRFLSLNNQLKQLITVFEVNYNKIKSPENTLKSDDVLQILRRELEVINYRVETSKTKEGKINIPVLFGLNGKEDKFFQADAVSQDGSIILEVEAGRAYVNNQFLKDIFQACMMPDVEYLALAVRNDYRGNDDFSKIYLFLETLYTNGRLKLPMQGIVLIGY